MEKHDELIQRGYVVDACTAVKIIFVYKPEDLLTGLHYYKPAMTHQIFTEETIYGYHGLTVFIYYLAHSGHCYFRIRYDKCYMENENPSPINDNIVELLRPWFPSFTLDINEIRQALAIEDRSKMFGAVVNSFSICHNSAIKNFKVTQCSVEEPGFVQFHSRFQSLIIMYIDAANFIDLEDYKWMIFYLYNATPLGANYPVGFCTVYKFLSFPEKIRTRISQFFIIPSYQRLGLGYRLLNTIYDVLRSMSDVVEMTVESPNVIFTRLRDKLDLSYVIKLPEFSAENVVKGYSSAMRKAAQLHLKLNRKQSKRIYYIIRYNALRTKHIDNYEAYKADVIKHLDHELKRRCCRSYSKLLPIENEIDREMYLEDQFDNFYKDIQRSADRLRLHFRT